MEAGQNEEASLFPARVGDKLRAARIAEGVDLPTIAERTRIPQRHLEAIESSNYSGLPSITYAMGFAKAYARQVGLDEVAIARDLRAERAHRRGGGEHVFAFEESRDMRAADGEAAENERAMRE